MTYHLGEKSRETEGLHTLLCTPQGAFQYIIKFSVKNKNIKVFKI